MHEFALAEAVISAVVKAAEEAGIRTVKEFTIRIGELQQIDPEVFGGALKQLSTSRLDLLAKASIKIRKEGAAFRCRVCSHEWRFADFKDGLVEEISEAIHFIPEMAYAHIRCPECSSPDFELTHGRGIWVDEVTGERG